MVLILDIEEKRRDFMNKIIKLRDYIEKDFKRTRINNISMCINLNDKEINKLKTWFDISIDCFGYINFKKR